MTEPNPTQGLGPDRVGIFVRVPIALFQSLQLLAEEDGRTVPNLVLRILNTHVKRTLVRRVQRERTKDQ